MVGPQEQYPYIPDKMGGSDECQVFGSPASEFVPELHRTTVHANLQHLNGVETTDLTHPGSHSEDLTDSGSQTAGVDLHRARHE